MQNADKKMCKRRAYSFSLLIIITIIIIIIIYYQFITQVNTIDYRMHQRHGCMQNTEELSAGNNSNWQIHRDSKNPPTL